MIQPAPRFRPQAIADYLRYRFQIRPGQALCLVLEQPQTRDNHEALVAWSREAVERYRIKGSKKLLNLIEGGLFRKLLDADLVDGMMEMPPVSPSSSAQFVGPAQNDRSERQPVAAQHESALRRYGNVVAIAGRNRHD